MSKHILIIIIIILGIIAGAMFFLAPESETQQYQKESIMLEQDLAPIELSQEEQKVLKEEGLEISSGIDTATKDLQSVRSSDELGAIEADLSETNLSGLDAELEAIDTDLLGL